MALVQILILSQTLAIGVLGRSRVLNSNGHPEGASATEGSRDGDLLSIASSLPEIPDHPLRGYPRRLLRMTRFGRVRRPIQPLPGSRSRSAKPSPCTPGARY